MDFIILQYLILYMIKLLFYNIQVPIIHLQIQIRFIKLIILYFAYQIDMIFNFLTSKHQRIWLQAAAYPPGLPTLPAC